MFGKLFKEVFLNKACMIAQETFSFWLFILGSALILLIVLFYGEARARSKYGRPILSLTELEDLESES